MYFVDFINKLYKQKISLKLIQRIKNFKKIFYIAYKKIMSNERYIYIYIKIYIFRFIIIIKKS